MRMFATTIAALATVTLGGCNVLPFGKKDVATTAAPPVQASSSAPVAAAQAQKFVVSANPIASEAGMAVLRRGGSAVDAAIAMQAMLSLVEPQSSGLGGGAFLNYFNAKTGKVEIYDGREVAPAGATPTMLLGSDGQPLPFAQAVMSGRATGVPGAVRMLGRAHADHGTLAWDQLFDDAEQVARKGFVISPRLGRFLGGKSPQLQAEDVRRYFKGRSGALATTGDRIKNGDYADFLRRLAKQGPDALYTGKTAQRIVARTTGGDLPGTMTLADLSAYRAVKRSPLCGNWRAYIVCTPPPPSSGVGLLELLAILGRTDIDKRGPNDPQSWYLFAEASRLMYADRDLYVGDPKFVNVPVAGLLAPAYIAERAKLIGPFAATACSMPSTASRTPASATCSTPESCGAGVPVRVPYCATIARSASSSGQPIAILNRNRSSCASGSGYTPCCSIGFCVATTVKRSDRCSVRPSMVMRRSCIASSSAACVLGGVRLISSASSSSQNTGPRVSANCDVWKLNRFDPMISPGIKSGVNWMRPKSRPSVRAKLCASSVLAVPGGPSSRT